MPIYEVVATKEVIYHVANIEANNESDAIQKVQQAYDNNTLDHADNISSVNFYIDGANEERVDY